MGKKRILYIVTRMNIGGVAAHLIELNNYFNNEDYESLIIAGKINLHDEHMFNYQGKKVKDIIHINSLKRNLNPFNDFIALLEIIKVINNYKPNIVHTHTAKAGVLGRLAAMICKVPLIIHTFHGFNFKEYFNPVFSFISFQVEKFLAFITNYLIVLSPKMKNELITSNLSNRNKIITIQLGFSFNTNDNLSTCMNIRKKYDIPDQNIIVASIGRLTQIKNYNLYIEIANKILKINNQVTFLLIGDGEERESLQMLIDNYNLNKNFIITGYQSNVSDFFEAIDIFLLTSKNEGTPVTIIEAMNFKKVIIAPNVGGIPDMISNNVNGYIFKTDNYLSVIDIIIEYINHPDKFKKIKENAFNTFNCQFSDINMFNQLKKLYNNDR